KLSRAGCQSRWPFPRSIDRGPIEAIREWSSKGTFRHFRDRLIAAPLKLWHDTAFPSTDYTFPRSIDRGPIEADKKLLARVIHIVFPRSIDRGPIEATRAESFCGTFAISAID